MSVAQPRGLVVLKKAGKLDAEVRKYLQTELKIICEVPALEIMDDGKLDGGVLEDGSSDDVLESSRSLASKFPGIVLGPDSIGTLSFTSGSTGIPKGDNNNSPLGLNRMFLC